MSELVSGSRILDRSVKGDIVEITFRGTHEWTHRGLMAQFIQDTLSTCPVTGVVINLLEYHYLYGDDVSGLFEASLDRTGKKPRPCSIVARGETHKSLYDFFKSSMMLDVLQLYFASSVDEALQELRHRLGHGST